MTNARMGQAATDHSGLKMKDPSLAGRGLFRSPTPAVWNLEGLATLRPSFFA